MVHYAASVLSRYTTLLGKYFIQKVTICQETLAFSANYTGCILFFVMKFMQLFFIKLAFSNSCCIVFPV